MNDSIPPDEAMLDAVRSATADLRLSPAARARIEQRLQRGSAGATTLRSDRSSTSRRIGWIAAAAAVLLAALWLLPLVDRSTAVSAAEILGRSQQALGRAASGIESTTYDLQLGGALEEILPIEQGGRFTVEELVDHDHPGRYRILKLDANRQVIGAAADDPVTGTRSWYFVTDGRGHLLRFPAQKGGTAFSLAAMRTFALQTMIGMMQGSDATSLHEVDRGGDAAYAIDVPAVTGTQGLIALDRARAVVARADARLLDFDAAGTIAGRPFTITFNLRARDVQRAAPAGAFSLTARPGDEVVDVPAASPAALLDLLGQCLRK